MAKEKVDYTVGVPINPPDGVYEWLEKKGAFKANRLIYKATKHRDKITRNELCEVKCTECGGSFLAKKEKIEPKCAYSHCVEFGYYDEDENKIKFDGSTAICPICGAESTVRHSSNISRYGALVASHTVMTVHVIDGKLTLLTWLYEVVITKDVQKRVAVSRLNGYIADGRKLGVISGYYLYFTTCVRLGNWENRCKFEDRTGTPDYIFPFKKSLIEKSNVPNCKLDKYVKTRGCAPVTYLNFYLKNKNLENLIMQGHGNFFNDSLQREGYYSYRRYLPEGLYNFKVARPCDILGLTKEEYNHFKSEEWSPEQTLLYRNKLRGKVKLSDTGVVFSFDRYGIERLIDRPNLPYIKVLKYIAKQRDKNSGNLHIDIGYYLDYIKMADENGEDVTSFTVLFPQDLRHQHDYEVKRKKYKESKALKRGFADRYKFLNTYTFTDNVLGLTIRPCKSEKELHDEGAILHHCVGTYANRHAKGETDIFFIRKVTEPDTPYYTLELNERERADGKFCVIQNRGLRNCARTTEITEFERIWGEHVVKALQVERIKENGRKKNNRNLSA